MAAYTESQIENSHEFATRDRLLLFVLLAATLLAAYLVYLLLEPFLPALAWALALAIIAHPVQRRVGQWIGHRGVAAGMTTVVVALVIIGPALFVAQQVSSQAIQTLQWIQQEDKLAQWQETLAENPRMGRAMEWIGDNVDLKGEAKQLLGTFTKGVTSWLSGTIWLVVQLLIMLLTLFFFLRDNQQVLGAVRSLVPLSHREANKVFRTVSDTIYATVFGTVTVAMVQGFMGSLIFFFMGIPGALLWGVVMGLLSIVPYLGAFVIWGPVAATALQGEWVWIILTGYGMTAIGLIDNLLYPFLVGHRIRLHTLVAFFAILGGATTFGMSGIVLGPVIVALSLALVDIWRHRTAAGQSAEKPA